MLWKIAVLPSDMLWTLRKKDDIIVLAGKGHETYQDIGGHKYHLDEREEVAAHLEEMRK